MQKYCIAACFLFSLVLVDSLVAYQTVKVDSCDVTWLWPVPENSNDVENLIDLDELVTNSGDKVWSDESFEDLLSAIDGGASAVRVTDTLKREIGLNDAFRKRATWKIAAMRIDPSAPGGSDELIEQFGEAPQIRLIVQPVTIRDNKAVVHDVAVHLVFSYLKGMEGSKRIPDREKFKTIVNDILALKKQCGGSGVKTAGAMLGVHPGLVDNSVPELTKSVESFLGKHLTPPHLTAMAIMGLQHPEPWIFVALFRQAPTERFRPLPIPVFTNPNAEPAERFKTAQMLNFRESPNVMPVPQTNNRNPITSDLAVPLAKRRGVSAAPLFADAFGTTRGKPAVVGTDESGDSVVDSELKNADIPDFIANPTVAHFFNTDCVSCHVESQRRFALNTAASKFAFKWPEGVSTLDPAVAQAPPWNVRNLGWFPDFFGKPTAATISQRTANETAEVVEFINLKYLE